MIAESERNRLREIKSFPSLIKYLRDELQWPIGSNDFEEITFDYTAEELGIDAKNAAKVQEIKQLRPLASGQPWGIFFVKFEPKRLPVVALRKILGRLVVKKKAANNPSDRGVWNLHDLLFISNYGDQDERQLTFAHFTQDAEHGDLPTLKVLGWDEQDASLHLDQVIRELKTNLVWKDGEAVDEWRQRWSSAFRLRPREVITTSRDLAVRLAELARDIRRRANDAMKYETDKGPLKKLMAGFRTALIHDLDEDRFADMYAQTIAYGLLSARVSRPAALVADNLADMVPITNPFLKELMETFLNVGGRKWNDRRGKLVGIDFDELGVNDVVDTLRQANMEAVLADFGNRNPTEDPVIHFYELFLKEYDAKMRMQRGVFYTPRPVVSYIVRSVHELLQTEFGLEDGLADTTTWAEMLKKHPPSPSTLGEGRGEGLKLPEIEVVDPDTRKVSKHPIDPGTPFVQILDPATGTATFLVEVIDVIHKHLLAKWKKQGKTEMFDIPKLWNDYVPKHLLPRLHGYELMMAPYAIAHMKIGLKLFETGYTFGSAERARIYLTNALEPPQDFSDTFEQMAPALAHEAKAVNDVKRHQRFTVVIGNPPYSKLSANRDASAESLVEPFKEPVRDEVNIQPLSDDYLKFLGLANATIAATRCGAVGMITNRGYIGGLIHRGVRNVLLRCFNRFEVLDLHGDSNVGETAPMGEANENVFDIKQGVAITICANGFTPDASVNRFDLWGTRDEKYAQLLALNSSSVGWIGCVPREPNFFLTQANEASDAEAWMSIDEIMPVTNTGIKTHRDDLVIDIDKAQLLQRLRRFSDPDRSDHDVRLEFFGASAGGRYKPGDNRDWSMSEARRKLKSDSRRADQLIHELDYRPFDKRFIFYSDAVIDFPRRDVMDHMLGGQNLALITTRQVPNGEFTHAYVTRRLVETKLASHDRAINVFPLHLNVGSSSLTSRSAANANISDAFTNAIVAMSSGSDNQPPREDSRPNPRDVLGFIYAVLHSPSYRSIYKHDLKIGFPRIPIPRSHRLFQGLIVLGNELVNVHLMESSQLERFVTTYAGQSNPEVEKITYANGTVWLDKAQTCGFAGVPEAVWNFHIGGYQVCEKWLKDRKGRTLSKDDIAHYQKIVVAISETIRLMKEIDEVIEKHGGWPGAFVTTPIDSKPKDGELPFA